MGGSSLVSSVAVSCVGVPRDDEDALAKLRRSNVGSGDTEPDRIIPLLGQSSENNVQSPLSERWDVLHDDDSGSKFANDAEVLEPETASRTRDASALPSVTEILTGTPAAEHIDSGQCVGDVGARWIDGASLSGSGADGANVVVPNSVGPMAAEDARRVFFTFHLKDGCWFISALAQRGLKAEFKSAQS